MTGRSPYGERGLKYHRQELVMQLVHALLTESVD